MSSSKRTYTLKDFADFGRKSFPDANAAIADPQLYVFEQRRNIHGTDPASEVPAFILAKERHRVGPYQSIQEMHPLGVPSLRLVYSERYVLSGSEVRNIDCLDTWRQEVDEML